MFLWKDGWIGRSFLSADLSVISRFCVTASRETWGSAPRKWWVSPFCQVFLMRWEPKGHSAQGVWYKPVISPASLKCILSYAIETWWCFYWAEPVGPESLLPVLAASLPATVFLWAVVSSHFLEDLLNEASASADMQQTCRKASCGRCPWDEPDPYLASQLQGDYPGRSCTGWTALRPFSCVVKPARKQGLNYSGKSTMLPSTLFLVFNWLTITICQAQKLLPCCRYV